MNKTTVQLDHPFEFEGERVTELKLRRIKFRDIEDIASLDGEIAKNKRLICNLAEVSPDLVSELDAVDVETLTEELAKLMGKQSV